MSKARELANLGNAYSDGALSNRNLIINGAMQVAQRGTSSTGVTGDGYFTVDRFQYHAQGSLTGAVTFEQSTDAPDGFKNSAKVTVTTTDTYAAGEYVAFPHYIEGNNLVPLGFGTAGAKPFTLSFWVKASVTGEYSVAFQNNDNDRNFMHTYSVVAANTWEYKTLTIPADTSGTWSSGNTIGMKVWISLGTGSTYAESSTSSAWQSGLILGSTNGVKLLENAGATWQITGVQLEAGDTATPFEHRSYGQELALCQRYFCKTYNYETAPGTATRVGSLFNSVDATQSYAFTGQFNYPVSMRAIPTIVVYNPNNGTAGQLAADSNNLTATVNTNNTGSDRCAIGVSNISIGTSAYVRAHATASAEL